jgi:hypothetical protein
MTLTQFRNKENRIGTEKMAVVGMKTSKKVTDASK